MTEIAAYVCGSFYTVTRCDGSWLSTIEESSRAVAHAKLAGCTGPQQRPRNPNHAAARERSRRLQRLRWRRNVAEG